MSSGRDRSAPAVTRRGVVAFGVLIAAVAIVAVWRTWPDERVEPATREARASVSPAPDVTDAPREPLAIAQVEPDAGVSAPPERAMSEPAPYDDPSDGLDLPPPPLTDAPPTPRPERPADRPAYVMEQREAGIRLLDRTIERLSREAEELERSGDVERARRTRVRIERTRAVRARRAEELEILRAGGTLPGNEPEPE